ncbi:MAG: hypothetical protein ACD_15C00137G0020 [uncultured bacterium]|nr:MAG: hypothetical protein ACD_15C00137G0020 [uncultured bacterium]
MKYFMKKISNSKKVHVAVKNRIQVRVIQVRVIDIVIH